MMAFLVGKKTYIFGSLLFITGGLRALNVIDQHTYDIIAALLAPLILVSMRHATATEIGKK